MQVVVEGGSGVLGSDTRHALAEESFDVSLTDIKAEGRVRNRMFALTRRSILL